METTKEQAGRNTLKAMRLLSRAAGLAEAANMLENDASYDANPQLHRYVDAFIEQAKRYEKEADSLR